MYSEYPKRCGINIPAFRATKKVPTFQSRPLYHFVCNFLSSSAGFNLCSCFFPAHPCLPLALPTFSRPSIPRLIVASFPLSDPRCFGILSSASVLDSDYSASVLPFLLFPVPPHSCFPGARLGSRLPRFPLSLRPGFSCLPSRFLYSASLFVSFRSSPLRSHSRSTGAYLPLSLPVFSTSAPLPFVRIPSVSSYSAFCSSFPSLPGSALQLLSRCPASALASSVSSFSPT